MLGEGGGASGCFPYLSQDKVEIRGPIGLVCSVLALLVEFGAEIVVSSLCFNSDAAMLTVRSVCQ